MSVNNVVLSTQNQAIINTDTSKIFIWENRYGKGSYTNSTGSSKTWPAGTLLGRISSSQLLLPLASGASDGSQFPVGILAQDLIVADGATVSVTFCNYGDVVEDKILLQGSDALTTVISGRSIRDRIGADTVGVRIVNSVEMTTYDNQ